MKAIVVFSHLRWDFIRQRPQQLMSRLARKWRIVFIEEPLPGTQRAKLEVFEGAPGVQVWRPHVPGEAAGLHDDHLPVLQELIESGMRDHGVEDYWLWFYTPMAWPLAARLKPRGIVYDCMDELAHLPGAPRQLLQRENQLFKRADLVFTAGRSLFNAKRHRHPDVHCFPGSVDAWHFAGAHGEHPLHADIPRPRLGYSGVIDERINLGLIDAIATARPEWNIVMVGPVMNIDARQLPRRDNIHWLGPQGYDELPRFISGWDVCLLPYALGDETKSLSPAKTLEYMACGRPAVSTSIRDTVEAYGHVVRVADTPEGFIDDIEMLMARSSDEQEEHSRQLAEIAAGTSWDTTAQSMAELIEQADDLADCGAAFVKPQPAMDEKEPVPLYLVNAAQAAGVIAPGSAQAPRTADR
jgi:glycosyltransferase involved in cell wall biosynthesis